MLPLTQSWKLFQRSRKLRLSFYWALKWFVGLWISLCISFLLRKPTYSSSLFSKIRQRSIYFKPELDKIVFKYIFDVLVLFLPGSSRIKFAVWRNKLVTFSIIFRFDMNIMLCNIHVRRLENYKWIHKLASVTTGISCCLADVM